MFAQPRPKKSLPPANPKKRKANHSVEEISFDADARKEYLTGFHKRKQHRIKVAQEQAALREKRERSELRKEVGSLCSGPTP
jgi:ribosomal RNA-processing protein 17